MIDNLNNYAQLFNEIIILLFAWCLLLFTNYVPYPKTRHMFGQGYIYILGFNLAVNLVILAYSLGKKLRLALKAKFCKPKNAIKSILKKSSTGKKKKTNQVDADKKKFVSFKIDEEKSESVESSDSSSARIFYYLKDLDKSI